MIKFALLTSICRFPCYVLLCVLIFPEMFSVDQLCMSGTVEVLSYPTLHTLHTLVAHTAGCYCIAIDPTGRCLVKVAPCLGYCVRTISDLIVFVSSGILL